MKELVAKIQESFQAFEKDAKAQIESGNKAAGTRRNYSRFGGIRIGRYCKCT